MFRQPLSRLARRDVLSLAFRRELAIFGRFVSSEATVARDSESSQQFTYRAETRSLLKIVAKALYTEREVFLRELVSNACDALEKVRLKQVAGEAVIDPDLELEVTVGIDAENSVLTISDTGIGMSKEELMNNLGTIALSGSKKFAEDTPAAEIIGQFGVGFYSAFMVGNTVEVLSKSSTGSGRFVSNLDESYKVSSLVEERKRGTTVVIHLKDDAKSDFLDEEKLRSIVQKYSKFASFPIKVGDKAVNTEALWTKKAAETTKAEYSAFYRSVFKAWDEPAFVQHFSADGPLDIKALIFFPSFHTEKLGMGRLEPSVSLYCRKMPIESPCRDLVPDWMRFAKGVVDSEDLPLSISREKSQDKQLLLKIQDVLVRKTLRFLQDKMAKERENYLKWYTEFNVFLKEGACHDASRRADIGKLLFFDSSSRDEPTSLDEYVSRLSPDDDTIYYLHSPSRDLAFASPYYEAFKKHNKECLFVYNTIDDFVMSNLVEFNGRQIKAAEGFREKESSADAAEDDDAKTSALTEWLVKSLEDRLEACEITTHLVDSPAVVAEAESAAVRRMMLLVSQQQTGNQVPPLPRQKLLINPNHKIIISLEKLVHADHDLALTAAHQLVDNAIVAAGLMDDARVMLTRLNKLLELAIVKPVSPTQDPGITITPNGSSGPASSDAAAQSTKAASTAPEPDAAK